MVWPSYKVVAATWKPASSLTRAHFIFTLLHFTATLTG